MCIILIGYKQFLWDDVIGRFRTFVPDDVDVCLVSSGKYLPELEEMAKRNSWSYLSVKRNNVCLVQNLAISLFPEAEYIYKMDEDIFLTAGAFEKLFDAMKRIDEESPYTTGISAPLLNINAYGYRRILEKTGTLEAFEKKFGSAPMMSGQTSMIETNPEVASFMWGSGGVLPQLDEMNALFEKEGFEYSVCPVRLSIGFILMKRSFWEFMGGFPVIPGNGMGLDETYLIGVCSSFSHVVAVAENSVVGHFGYGGAQGRAMKEFFEANHELFELK